MSRIVTKAALFNPGGEILVLRKNGNSKRRPYGWDLPGGQANDGEPPETAIYREVIEEAGIRVPQLRLAYQAPLSRDDGPARGYFFVGKVLDCKIFLGEEHDMEQWLPMEDAGECIEDEFQRQGLRFIMYHCFHEEEV